MNELLARKSKIVCTIGPSCMDEKTLADMTENGMAIARLNVSHGTRENHIELIERLRSISTRSTFPLAIMIDTRGAEIRTGDVLDPIQIHKGQEVIFTSDADHTDHNARTVVRVNYDGFASDVLETDTILIDNGELSFDIISTHENGIVIAQAKEDGHIGSRRHINLPGADIDLPSVTDKDWEDIKLAVDLQVDCIALSFIRNAEEVVEVRKFLDEHQSPARIISKIETRKGVQNIADIIDVSDGIMVARGDLGADVPFEELPAIQDEIVVRCRDAGKPVIIATHMLESMTEHPIPTRAEVTDTAYAVMTGADATMLSGETAGGKHPLTALQAMVRIQLATEKHIARFGNTFETKLENTKEEDVQRLLEDAERKNVRAILVQSESDESLRVLSKFRSRIPILVSSSHEQLLKQLMLHYGVFPLNKTASTVKDAVHIAVNKGILQAGDSVFVVVEDLTTGELLTV